MKIQIKAEHKYIDEIQTIAQVFFPHAKFTPEESTQWAIYSCIEKAEVYESGILRGSHNQAISGLNEKRHAMLVLYHALQKAVGAFTPWGALTGVRPTKMVREWMAKSQPDSECINTLTNIFKVQDDRAKLAVEVAHAEISLAKLITNTIGLYVSIPFCPSRCIYCSFNTAHKPWDEDMQARYIKAIIKEIPKLDENISSIYIGGGTPTALTDDMLEKLLYAVPKAAEFTVEAGRPDTITRSKLKIMKKYNVNRISINPQTFNDRTLKAIGRNHTAKDFFQAYEMAREEGFICINTDIIAGLPGETPADMHHTMETLEKLAPENITIHTLAIKRASKLNEQRIDQSYLSPEAKIIESQLKIAHNGCVSQGLNPYYLYRQKNMAALFENTGYSLPGKECLYNVGMMAEIHTVLGVGAAAVSKYIEGTKITRTFNPKNPDIYIERRQNV
ncbi:MAG: coproporphyrinogen dehydrogenase HemZ [Defluviitaleaceae bacterium]|nr:coproporphyrinogen dehydrogenase HemZ [Defluviitaleaceae bacterium]